MNRPFLNSVAAVLALLAYPAAAKVTPTVTVTTAPASPTFGQQVTLTATVAGSSPTGKVTFLTGTAVIGTAPVIAGVANLVTDLLPPETTSAGVSVTAFYVGDANNNAASGTGLVPVVARAGKGFQGPAGGPPSVTGASNTVVGDFNSDGKMDLAVTGSSNIYILLGNGDGTFSLNQTIAFSGASLLAIGDFNEDGHPDLAVLSTSVVLQLTDLVTNSAVFLGSASGNFTPGSLLPISFTLGGAFIPEGIAVADLNRDGHADVAIIGSVVGQVYTFLGDGSGGFPTTNASQIGTSTNGNGLDPNFVVAGNFTSDTIPDLIVEAEEQGTVSPTTFSLFLMTGQGDGTFNSTDLSLAAGGGTAITSGDFNGDGVPDVAYFDASFNLKVALSHNPADGTFTASSTTSTGLTAANNKIPSIVTGDFNGDGKLDAVVYALGVGANPSTAITFLGNGDGTFTASPTTVSVSTPISGTMAVGDFNGDSREDFVVPGTTLSVELGVGPNLTSLQPAVAVAGATNVSLTLNGSNFTSGDVVSWLENGTPTNLTGAVVGGAGATLTVPIPSALLTSFGTATVTVTDPSAPGLSSLPLTFTINAAPSITGLTVNVAAQGGVSLPLVINGSGFVTGDIVNWQPVTGNAVQLKNGTPNLSGTTLTITIPAQQLTMLGTVAISVIDPSGVASNAVQFTIQPAPQLTSLSTTVVPAGTTNLTLTINGTSFLSSDTVVSTTSAGLSTPLNNPLPQISPNQIIVQFPSSLLANANNLKIQVTDPDGAPSNSLTLAVLGPTIASFDPPSVGTNSGDFTLVVTGANFVPGTDPTSASTVQFIGPSGAQTPAPTLISTTSATVTVKVPGSLIGKTPGTAQVAVVNPGGATSTQMGLPVAAPQLLSVNPPSAATGGNTGLNITVTGTNFVSASTVLFCNNCGNSPDHLATTFVNNSTLTAQVPLGDLVAVGVATIQVTNDPTNPTSVNTLSTNSINFPVSALTVTQINPSFVLAGSGSFNMTITGQNFGSGATILFGNQPVLTPNSLTSTLITVTIPANYIASAASVQVSVENPNGAVSSPVSLTVGQLSITGIAPSPIVAGSPSFAMTVSGTSFSSATQVEWTSGTVPTTLTTTFIDAQHLTAVVPAALVTSAGSALISTVTGNVASAPISVTIEGPSLVSVTPQNSGVGVPSFAIQVSGFNFLTGSTIQWSNGIGQPQTLQTTFVNSQNLTALVPASLSATTGTALISVQNPGGAVSNGLVFQVGAPPTINTDGTGLTPGTAVAGNAAFQLVVTGTNYQTGSIVQWANNGTTTALVTAFTNAEHLTANVPASLINAPGAALITVLNPGGALSNGVLFSIGPGLVPTLTALDPATGVTAGSAAFQMNVTGTNFASGAVVQWANGATPVSLASIFVDSGHLSAIVPANLVTTVGTAIISVLDPGGASSNSLFFTINALPAVTITSLNQTTVTAGGPALTLQVTGQSFTSSSVVQWNAGAGPQALATIYLGATGLSALVPATLTAATGTAFINVLNTGGALSNAVVFSINPQGAPSIAAGGLAPSSATEGSAAQQLTITGTNFTSGSLVQWDSGAGTQNLATIFVSSTELTLILPASLLTAAGTAFINVQNPGGIDSGIVAFPISAATAPMISGSLSPAQATVGGAGFQLTVNGSNFVNASVVQWNPGTGAQALNTTFINSTQLTAIVPASMIASVGTVFISVLNPGGVSSNVVSFSIGTSPGPTIISPGGLSPSVATAGGAAVQLGVTGSNFVNGATVQWVTGGTPQGLATAFVSSSQLEALVPATLIAAAGTAFVDVANPNNGGVSNLVTFTINAVPGPTIATSGGISPASAGTGSPGATITVTGANFANGSTVQWNSGGTPTPLTTGFVNSTQLTALIPASLLALPATALITVVNPDMTVSNAITFFVTGSVPSTTPTLSAISPASASAGSATLQLSVTGLAFVAASATVAGSVVQWNGTPIPTNFVSVTQLSATVDASLLQAAGNNFVSVVNGTLSSSGTKFQVNGPTLSAITPASITAGVAAFTLTATGTNFVSGSTVSWNGANLATTVASATQLTAQVPANLVASAGDAFVLVTSPGGAITAPQFFTIGTPPAPTLTSLSPATTIAGGPAFQLTVTGTGFVNGSVVMWNGAALATGFISATQVTALIGANLIVTAGSANITVQNPGAPLSAVLALSVTGPSITSLAPTTANAGDPSFTLTVTGTNFVAGSAVQWNGTVLPSSFSSSTQLLASVPTADVVSPGTASVTVLNPGGAVSAYQTFTIGQPALQITTATLPDGVVGTGYSQTVAAQGGTQPYNWTITAGTLPAGLILAPSTGTISGTPTGAANGTLGFTVTDAQGRTATKSMQLNVALALLITTTSPLPMATAGTAYSTVLAATGGTPQYLWSVAGTLPPGLVLNVATGQISGRATTPGGYTFTISVTDSRGQQTASQVFTIAVTVSALNITGLNATEGPAQQVPMNVTISTAYTVDLSGTLTITFVSAVGGDDPSIQFSTGGRTVNFTIPAGTTTAVYPQNAQLLLTTGTVAGTITITPTLQAGASDITPSGLAPTTTAVPKEVPVITSAALHTATGGVVVTIAGYSTSKELVQATLQFNAAAGSSLTSGTATVPLTATLNTWYQSAAAAAFGSQFTISLPVQIQGNVAAIGSVTITLTNTLGNSAPITAPLQ